MQFDPNNIINQLCAKGMEMEGNGNINEAKKLFLEAWEKAATDSEKFIAAHYVARHQPDVQQKLKWDELALSFALKINDDAMKASYPSLYLNIAKCFEDLDDITNAKTNYETALSYTNYLKEDGYGQMIKAGIKKALERIA